MSTRNPGVCDVTRPVIEILSRSIRDAPYLSNASGFDDTVLDILLIGLMYTISRSPLRSSPVIEKFKREIERYIRDLNFATEFFASSFSFAHGDEFWC